MKLLLALAASAAAWAQPVSVYSEFARISPAGVVTAPETPREILSPALVRNGFTSFQVVVQAPASAKWWLYVGENPENAVKITMYRESGEDLEPVELPRQSAGTEVFWMDVWTAADAPLARVKIEPELFLNDSWVIYPIEARVMEAKVSDQGPGSTYVCTLPPSEVPTPAEAAHFRNALQDATLARQIPKDELAKLQTFCGSGTLRWTEEYLRIRDYLFRLR